ncbi:HlyD family type I secretion periplasmic adaptor subunit [Polymorphobacter fuscus]|uniref:Membrane fusion protein (MFP) family protein n=1 Tax=Sandarakinorhabdus fusca TaxID=1439888 RepID=A0A7C9GNZ3_9SPHN|nr:HlyD family type I secretion periplasmic adaptor subunit [Polymorphobacter fuscus]KAB7648980.1 HlyD family type I secretion periplasmic adaptor subunit [Polymorphobacter fuscus]MQT16576.1 HlyD family type I secretion periplasmic adaptor subunit [Polymorphobacter fuscus]NJC07133.1 adhesin transport system membrane fusion protein [Polymorphobacter fuscus]
MTNIVETALVGAPDRVKERDFASILLWVIVALTLALLLWAALARVDEVVHAQGKVMPSSRLQVVSNLEGGVVSQILVHAGDKVAAGQPLLRLDATAVTADFNRSDTTLDSLVARAARLDAEARGRPLVFPAAIETRAAGLVANERALHTAQMSARDSERSIAAARIDQARRGLAQAEADADARGEALAQAEREVAIIAPLVEKGAEPRLALVRAESSARQAASVRDGAVLAARRAAAALTEAQGALHSVDDRFRATASDALATTRAEIAAQSKTLPALADRMRRAELRAPVAGIVNRVLATTVGGSIRPGEPLVEVVPLADSLIIEAMVAPADIAFLRPGQKASVKISAYDYSVYGALPGRVESIAPDATVNERTGESHFTVRVRTDTNALAGEGGVRLPISAGMMADVDVLGRERTVLNYLLTPLTRLRDTAFREKL